MLRLDKVIKPWKESAALNDHINLYGFWNETAFLTKSGDVGMILSVPGVDYESLDRSEQEYAVKRLEAALKAFGPGFHVYQYLFKSNRPDIPFATYDDPIVQAAIDQRQKFFEAKRDHLYQVEIFYCILLEGSRSKTGVGMALARLLRDPEGAIAELKSQFTNDSMKKLLRAHIERDLQRLDQHVQAFARQLADFMRIEVLNQQGQFTFFRRLLNYDDWRVAGKPQSTQFLDYQVVNSDIEAERDHLRVGDHIVRVLTMKEAITETRPLVLDALLKIPANFYVVTEWTPLPADKARKEVNKRRRHFNMSKTGFVSQMGNDATKTNPRDVLVDESKQADIENLGDCLRALGDGQSLGDFSLTIVLYGQSRTGLDQLVAEFNGVFTNADGNLFAETYNQLNAYFATVPGNYALNLRKLYLLNTNYADLSFLFTILPGEKTNAHLGTEYLAVAAYLDATSKHLYTMEIQGVWWLNRALSLSLKLRDERATQQVVASILEFRDRVAEPTRSGVWTLPFDTLYGKKGLLTPGQESKVIADLETMLARTSDANVPDGFDPHGAEAAADRLAQHYRRQNDRGNVHRVIRTYGKAFENLSKQANPMLAMAWLQPVIERFEQEGMKEEAERLQLLYAEKGKNIKDDLKEYSTRVELKKEELDEQVEQLVGSGDLSTSLQNIAQFFIPKTDHARKLLEQMRTDAPLLGAFSIKITESDGHTSAKVGSLDKDPEGRLHMQLGQTMAFYQPILVITLERMRERYKPKIDEIFTFLHLSPLFVDTENGLLHDGLEAYEKEDFVKAIHILVPQVEHILRGFLAILKIPTLKTVRGHPGIMDAKSMNDMLSDERVRKVLTEDLWRYLTVLYIEKKGGLNLRNDLTHGLLRRDVFSRSTADRVFHSLLALSLLR
ncbi:MAG TPA: DUF4209 domain-containing protein [Candidatus Sulfotelmatobacter sp.]